MNSMDAYIFEFIGTAILLYLGNAVVANVLLKQTKGHQSGWIVITLGWGIAVFVAVFVSAASSGAHINPAVTLGFAFAGSFDWIKVPGYLAAQFAGGAFGAFLVWLQYKDHFAVTDDADAKLACFCTGPAIRNKLSNFLSETLGTFILVFAVFHIAGAKVGTESASLGALDALPVALLVLGIGLSLGGTTGYAINPARDFSPRVMHSILPIQGKRNGDWSYSWIPLLGPIAGALLAAVIFRIL